MHCPAVPLLLLILTDEVGVGGCFPDMFPFKQMFISLICQLFIKHLSGSVQQFCVLQVECRSQSRLSDLAKGLHSGELQRIIYKSGCGHFSYAEVKNFVIKGEHRLLFCIQFSVTLNYRTG